MRLQVANFIANFGLDMASLDLNRILDGVVSSSFSDNSPTVINGQVYQDTFVVVWETGGQTVIGVLGASELSASDTNIFGGTASGYHEFVVSGSDLVPVYEVSEASFSAVEWFSSVLTPDTGDDIALFSKILSGNDSIRGGVGINNIFGLTGNDLIEGGPDNDSLNAGEGNDVVIGGAGNDRITGGPGNDIATGGAGADEFVFVVGHGTLSITDFEPGVDDLVLGGLRLGFSVGDLIPFVSQQGDDVVIASGGQEVRFENTQLSELSAGDVVFV